MGGGGERAQEAGVEAHLARNCATIFRLTASSPIIDWQTSVTWSERPCARYLLDLQMSLTVSSTSSL